MSKIGSDYYQKERPELVTFIPESYQRVLEIGCGAGCFRAHLRKDAEVWGVELSPTPAEEARKNLDNVLLGSYQDVADQLPDAYFDLIICNDVMEHMPDHDWFL